MDDFNIDDYKIQDVEMTYADAVDHLERMVKFLEDTHQNHFLAKIARQLLDDAEKQDPKDQANFAITNFIQDFGNPEMMDKLSGEEKTEDVCDWNRVNSTYSMRDVPESAPASKFRALCEEAIKRLDDVQD